MSEINNEDVVEEVDAWIPDEEIEQRLADMAAAVRDKSGGTAELVGMVYLMNGGIAAVQGVKGVSVPHLLSCLGQTISTLALHIEASNVH